MQLKKDIKKLVFYGVQLLGLIILVIGLVNYLRTKSTSKINYPLLIDELRFQSEELCQKLDQTLFYEDLKQTVQQVKEFDFSYQSDFLEKASILIQSLQLLQQYETGSQGDASLFQLHIKNLRQCSNSTSQEKLELKELKNLNDERYDEYNNEKNLKRIEQEQKNDELVKIRQNIKKTESNYITVIYEQEQKIQQKERLRRSYKNETELATYISQIEIQIQQQNLTIQQQEKYLQKLIKQMKNKTQSFNIFDDGFQHFKSQLQDSKSLELVFAQFYLKEDLPIVQVLKDYHVHLQMRYENIQTLVNMEPDPIQKQINIQMQNDIKNKIDIFVVLLNKIDQQKLDSQNGISIFDTPFENMTLFRLKEQIKINDKKYTILLTNRSQLEIDLTRHQDLLEVEQQRLKHEQFKLSKFIEERKTLDQDKDQQKEIQRISQRIISLENEKQEYSNQLELFKQQEQLFVQFIKDIDDQFEIINKNYQNQEFELKKEYQIREYQLKQSLRDCIKEKKLYEHYKQNQEQNTKKIQEIRDQIPEQVIALKELIKSYSQTYDLLKQTNISNIKDEL